VNDWIENWNFDVLTDEWPDAICFLFPPEHLTRAAMSRAILENMQGKDVIFLAKDRMLERTIDTVISRTVGIYKQMGSLVFEPFKRQDDASYSLYLFLTPETVGRIML